jgi:hypothetical protein
VGAIPLSAEEIVFLLRDEGDGLSKVRRESDRTEATVPTKRLRKAPLPPAPPPPEDDEAEGTEADSPAAAPPAPILSDDEDDDIYERDKDDEDFNIRCHMNEALQT